jgi:hypothetical protein
MSGGQDEVLEQVHAWSRKLPEADKEAVTDPGDSQVMRSDTELRASVACLGK